MVETIRTREHALRAIGHLVGPFGAVDEADQVALRELALAVRVAQGRRSRQDEQPLLLDVLVVVGTDALAGIELVDGCPHLLGAQLWAESRSADPVALGIARVSLGRDGVDVDQLLPSSTSFRLILASAGRAPFGLRHRRCDPVGRWRGPSGGLIAKRRGGLRALDAAVWSPEVSPAPPAPPGREFFRESDPDSTLVAALDRAIAGYVKLAPAPRARLEPPRARDQGPGRRPLDAPPRRRPPVDRGGGRRGPAARREAD